MNDKLDIKYIDVSNTETGLARRMIDLKRRDENTVVGWLEDDFHHFSVTIEHADDIITNLTASAVRYPWATCAFAPQELAPAIGKRLLPRSSDIGSLLQMRQQCTHIFDLTGLTMAHALRGISHRHYHVITDSREILGWKNHKTPFLGATRIRLLQDGEEVMQWHSEGSYIVDQENGHRQTLGRGFRNWTESLPLDSAEYATILRRALLVAGGRAMSHDRYPSAADMEQPELCFSFQSSRRNLATRMNGTTKDYSDCPEAMLAYASP